MFPSPRIDPTRRARGVNVRVGARCGDSESARGILCAMSDVPYFLETRVRQALVSVQEVARRKGLTDAFDVELFASDRAVRDLPCGAPVGRVGRCTTGRR